MNRTRMRSALLAVLLIPAFGCNPSPPTALFLGAGTFGLGAAFGFLIRDSISAPALEQRQCFLNGEPIDCAQVPSAG